MRFFVNTIIQWDGDGESERFVERILWIESPSTIVVLIDLFDTHALPRVIQYSDLVTALDNNNARTLEMDPYAIVYPPDNELSDARIRSRDAAWQAIQPVVDNPHSYFRRERGRLIREVSNRTGLTRPTIYRLLRRYWQRGQVLNALLPDYHKRGGPGGERLADESDHPSIDTSTSGEVQAIPRTREVRDKLLQGIQQFYLTTDKVSLQKAFSSTLAHFFNIGYKMDGDVEQPILPPVEERPTFSQFLYLYRKHRDPRQIVLKRLGTRYYESNARPILGHSREMSFGPGSLYQFDATPLPIQLVSTMDRSRLVGEPTMHLIYDVFSGSIAGFDLSLEEESWHTAMLAIDNAVTDKVKFCKAFDIDIDESEWPAHHLPAAILADRGPMESHDATNLARSLGVRVYNTPPYRPELKGIVERGIRSFQDDILHYLKGVTRYPHERGDRDPRDEAALTLPELTTIVIRYITLYNVWHWIDKYPLDSDMIADGLEPRPTLLWHWGIQNRVGGLRTLPQEIVRLNLLPHDTASVRRNGLYFRGLHYIGRRALEENWLVQVGNGRRSWKVPIAYDPRSVDAIYLRLDGNASTVERCELVARDAAFAGHTFDEVVAHFARLRAAKKRTTASSEQARSDRDSHIRATVDKATEEAAAATEGLSKAQHVGNVTENRSEERNRNRREDAWSLDEVDATIGDMAPPLMTSSDESENVDEPTGLEDLIRIQREMLDE